MPGRHLKLNLNKEGTDATVWNIDVFIFKYLLGTRVKQFSALGD